MEKKKMKALACGNCERLLGEPEIEKDGSNSEFTFLVIYRCTHCKAEHLEQLHLSFVSEEISDSVLTDIYDNSIWSEID